MKRFMEVLSGWYRKGVVIFDVAPVLGAPDASVLAMNVGQLLLVVEANRTGTRSGGRDNFAVKGLPKDLSHAQQGRCFRIGRLLRFLLRPTVQGS